ncbi:hypothetical protein RUM43_003519 [Polyplax serrata]|uniref:Uncharacterized protein n=1 Tax=Polyplax serrata TaxID=468196 RepID=A0AAN8P2E5_POLSC
MAGLGREWAYLARNLVKFPKIATNRNQMANLAIDATVKVGGGRKKEGRVKCIYLAYGVGRTLKRPVRRWRRELINDQNQRWKLQRQAHTV